MKVLYRDYKNKIAPVNIDLVIEHKKGAYDKNTKKN